MSRNQLTYVFFLLSLIIALAGSSLAAVPAIAAASAGASTAHVAPLVIAQVASPMMMSPDRPSCQIAEPAGC